MARSINKVIIVGNLTRDPELRYTPNGQPVATFGVATNRRWATNGEPKEETEFHNIVAWGKLAEICSQLLKKGLKVYIEGRLRTRQWEGKDGVRRNRTEIVALDMVVLSPRGEAPVAGADYVAPEEIPQEPEAEVLPEEEVEVPEGSEGKAGSGKGAKKESGMKSAGGEDEDVDPEAIPF